MKKLFIGLFTVMLAVSFIACKPSSGTDDNSTTDQTSSGGDSNSNGGNQNPAPTYIGTKAPTEAKAVGDIVFTDGSATAYTTELTLTDAQKAAAIAVIYKVDGTKPYGVGLVHNRDGLAWCSNSASAYNQNIADIQCKPDDGGSEGNYTFANATDKDGSNNFEQIKSYLISMAENFITDDTTGEGAADRYPAFYFAKNYKDQTNSHVNGTDYEDGWYLPTLAELFDVWKEKETVDAVSALCGGSEFDDSEYWSSSQDASLKSNAYRLDFDSGEYYCVNKKNDEDYVCCIRAFN